MTIAPRSSNIASVTRNTFSETGTPPRVTLKNVPAGLANRLGNISALAWVNEEDVASLEKGLQQQITLEKNRALVRSSGWRSVFLDVPWATIEQRMEGQQASDRPLFRDPDQARALFDERLESYRTADVHLSLAGDESVAEVVDHLVDRLPESPCDI